MLLSSSALADLCRYSYSITSVVIHDVDCDHFSRAACMLICIKPSQVVLCQRLVMVFGLGALIAVHHHAGVCVRTGSIQQAAAE